MLHKFKKKNIGFKKLLRKCGRGKKTNEAKGKKEGDQ